MEVCCSKPKIYLRRNNEQGKQFKCNNCGTSAWFSVAYEGTPSPHQLIQMHYNEIKISMGLQVEQFYNFEPLGLWDNTLMFIHYRVSKGYREITIGNLIERITEYNCIGAMAHEGLEMAIAMVILEDFTFASLSSISIHKLMPSEPDYTGQYDGLPLRS